MSAEDLTALLSEDIVAYRVEVGSLPPVGDQSQLPLQVPFRPLFVGDVTTDPLIMIVDDEPINAKLAKKCLKSQGYRRFIVLTDPRQAVEAVTTKQPDLVLLDIMMPGISGLEILEQLRADERFVDLPVVILTAAADSETKTMALELGATDFLAKPVDHAELVARTRNVLAAKAHHDDLKRRTWQLELERPIISTEMRVLQQELVLTLARAVESRGHGTAERAIRVGRYAGLIAAALGLGQGLAAMIEQAAPLHDIGMIGVGVRGTAETVSAGCSCRENRQPATASGSPKDGQGAYAGVVEPRRDDHRLHTEIGARMLRGGDSPLLRTAARIALTHHERWDGYGYPLGFSGDRIPIEGRITAVADAFERLCAGDSGRWSLTLEECFETLRRHRGTHFDPDVVDAFVSCRQDVLRIQDDYCGLG